MPCKLINADTVQELLTMKDTVDACEIAFAIGETTRSYVRRR